jgi:class 3 adenylate cyclase
MVHHVALLPDYILDMVRDKQIRRLSHLPLVRSEELGILFTDVSSFTVITEKVSAQGHYGVEIITDLLHAYFDEMVNCISSCGGDVIKFGGDSIVAVFKGKRKPVLDRIYLCTKQMFSALERINPFFQEKYGFTVSFHGGVSYGKIDACIVGDPQYHLDYYFSGKALLNAFVLGGKAGAGEVLFPADFAAPIKQCRIIETENTESQNTKSSIGEQFLPQSVKLKLKTQSSRAELRNAAVIFIGLESQQADEEIP